MITVAFNSIFDDSLTRGIFTSTGYSPVISETIDACVTRVDAGTGNGMFTIDNFI